MSLNQGIFINVHFNNRRDQPHILVIRHSTAVVDLRPEEVQNFIWDYIVLIEQHLQLLPTHSQILIRKLIRNIPTNGAKFTPVLYNSVEEAKSEQQFLVLLWLFALVHLLLVHVLVCPQKVIPQP